jgi:hypothetical protein
MSKNKTKNVYKNPCSRLSLRSVSSDFAVPRDNSCRTTNGKSSDVPQVHNAENTLTG